MDHSIQPYSRQVVVAIQRGHPTVDSRAWIGCIISALTLLFVLSVAHAQTVASIGTLDGGRPAIFPGNDEAIVNKGTRDGVVVGDRFDIIDPSGKTIGLAEAGMVTEMVSSLWVVNLKADSALAAGDHFVKRNDSDQGIELALQVGHSRDVKALVFTRDDRFLISSNGGGEVKIWDPATGKVLATSPKQHVLGSLAVAPDGNTFITGDATGDITIWDLKTVRPHSVILAHKKLGIGERIGRVAYSRDGDFFISTAWDNSVKIWASTSSTPIKMLQGAFETIEGNDAALSPDKKYVATQASRFAGPGPGSSYHCVVSVWNLDSQAIERSLECDAGNHARTLAYSPDGRFLAAGTDGHKVFLWDVKNGYAAHVIPVPYINFKALAFSPDGATLVANGPDKAILVVDVATYTAKELPWKEETTSFGFSKDGRILAVGASSGSIALVSFSNFQVFRELNPTPEQVTSVAMSSDGATAAAASGSGQIRLWDLASGQPALTLQTKEYSLDATLNMAFSPDNLTLAVDSDDGRYAAILFSTQPGQMPTLVPNCSRRSGFETRPPRVAYSPSGKFLAYSHGTTLGVWDVINRKNLGCVDIFDTLSLEDVEKHLSPMDFAARLRIQYSDDESLTVFTSEGMIGKWSVRNGTITFSSIQWTQPTTSVAAAPDGRTVARLSTEDVQIVNLDTGATQTYELMGPAVSDILDFSHDGKYLAVGDVYTVRIYDLTTGRVTAALRHTSVVDSFCFSPDDRLLLTASGAGQMTLWQLLNNQPLVQILNVNQEDWLAIDEDGFFDGSENAWNAVLFHSPANPLQLFEPERFFSLFYQPGMIAAVDRNRRPVREYLKKLGDSRSDRTVSQLLGSHIPDVVFESPHGQSIASAETVPVQLKVLDTGSGIGDCRVFRNRAMIYRTRATPSHGPLSFQAHLATGINDLSAYCFNKDGIKSQTATARVTNSLPPAARPRAYIVSIGINDYGDPNLNLLFAENDAEDMAIRLGAALAAGGRYEVIPLTLRSRGAQKQSILKAISSLASSRVSGAPVQGTNSQLPAGPNDVVVVFFAGHGMSYHDHYYLVPADIGQTPPGSAPLDDARLAAIASRSLSETELGAALELVDAGHLMLIIDACSSAALLSEANERVGPLNTHSFAEMSYEKGLFLIAAAQNYQAALEHYFSVGGRGNGLLTRALAWDGLPDSLRSNSRNGPLTAAQWLDSAVSRVVVLSAVMAKPQTSHAGDDGSRSDSGPSTQRPRDFYPSESADNAFVILSR